MVNEGDAERLRRIQLITDAALSHLDLNDLLAELLTRIRDVLGADTAAVLLRDELRNELVARAAVGLEEEVEQGVRIPIGGGFAGRIAATRHPIVLDDVDHAHVLNPILRQKGIKSLAGVPLVFANDVLGVLHVGTLTPREFTKDDVEFLEVVADRVALAIEHARLFEAERRSRTRLEQVHSVMETTLASLGFEELVGELLVRLRDVLQVDTAAVLMLDESTNELVARAAVGLEEEVEQGVRIPVGGGFAGRVASEARPIVLDDVDHSHVLNPILREKGIKSMLGVPLIASESVIGVLHVGTLEPRLFDLEDQELLQLVASRAALAIEGARVHDELVRLDQVKLNFVAIASHELRTPATAVFGIASTLRHRGNEIPLEARTELEEALWEQAVRFRRLIEQLLDLSRLDAKAILIEPQPLALHDLLVGIAESAGATEIRIDVPRDFELQADREALERIFGNLLTNAAKYGEPPVVVTAQARDTFFRVSVEDTGEGVPPDLVPRLFERFERGSIGQGSGLGLSIARAYARAHGGELMYDPQPNGGARFELILPRGGEQGPSVTPATLDLEMDHLAAVGDPELREALLFARSHARPVTADELAQEKGLHRNVARSRLERLVDAGLLAASFERRTGRSGPGAGRPAKTYSVVPQLESIEFPADPSEPVAALLVDALVTRAGDEPLREVGVEFGRELARSARLRPAKRLATGFERVCEAVRRLGYQASLEHVDGNGAVIATPTCPLRPLVRARPEAVEIDRGMWAGLASSALDGVEVGDVRCETRDCFDDHASCKVVFELSKR